jgi:integrase
VSREPGCSLKLPSFEKPLIVPLTVEQIEAIENCIDDRWAMVTVQAGAGLRIGELVARRVEDVDFLRKTVRVQYQFADTDSKVRSEPKTARSKRVIPVPQFVIDAIAEHLSKYEAGGRRHAVRHRERARLAARLLRLATVQGGSAACRLAGNHARPSARVRQSTSCRGRVGCDRCQPAWTRQPRRYPLDVRSLDRRRGRAHP